MRHTIFCLAALSAGTPLMALQPPSVPASVASTALSYVDLVDLTLAAHVVAGATIHRVTRLKGADATGVAEGAARFYIEADVEALIRGSDGLPTAVNYLVDLPLLPNGRAPKLKKLRVILMARPVAGNPSALQLVSPAAQLDWTAATEQRLRAIVTALLAAGAPPRITGIANAFHVAGSLPGESETQIFLTTADKRPISLNVLRHPGEAPRWAVALSEMVDEAAAPPAPETLLWYRLACGLPATLPDSALTGIGPSDAAAARVDYAVVLAGLGPCRRALG